MRLRGHAVWSLPGEQWTHKGPLVSQHAAAFISDPVRGGEVGIFAEQSTVLLISQCHLA
jgi:hypothetical protein